MHASLKIAAAADVLAELAAIACCTGTDTSSQTSAMQPLQSLQASRHWGSALHILVLVTGSMAAAHVRGSLLYLLQGSSK